MKVINLYQHVCAEAAMLLTGPHLTLVNIVSRRIACEGIPFIVTLPKTWKLCLEYLCSEGRLPDTILGVSGCSTELTPASLAALLGVFSSSVKLAPLEGAGVADYEGFLLRSKEVSNFQGARYEDILPMSRADRASLRRLIGPAPGIIPCKHGPGSTAEKLYSWDKWLAIDKPTQPIIRMTDVPKDTSKRRLIGIEHTKMQFLQQGIAAWLRQTRFFDAYIHLEDQNRHVARVTRDDVTIDLSDASDRIGPALVEYLLPDIYETLAAHTSSYVELKDRSLHSLGMMCTMGNGFCFELETLVFHIVAALSGRIYDATDGFSSFPLEYYLRQVAVYGDDIIIPERWYSTWLVVASSLGWKPNFGKTAVTPQFKETCGTYLFLDQDRYTAIRRLCPSLTIDTDGASLFWKDQKARLSCALAFRSAGFTSTARFISSAIIDQAPVRWNSSLQLTEIKLTSESAITRPLSVTEDTRYLAYWKGALIDQKDEDTGLSRVSRAWFPFRDYAVLSH